MPKNTSGETATRIKDKVIRCNKFILLATNGAIESEWCNWELGFGDAKKFKDNIALFPFKPKGDYDWNYKGNEYMSIYPHIVYYGNDDGKYNDGRVIKQGYYVSSRYDNQTSTITPLINWFNQKGSPLYG